MVSVSVIRFDKFLINVAKFIYTVEHIYDACPIYSELENFRIIAYLYVSDGSRR